MRYTAAAAGALALVTTAAAQNVVSFDLNRGLPGLRVGTPPSATLTRRDFHAGSINNNITGGGYYVDVKVGTPGQPITMVLDTGSSDAWFLSYQADLCTSRSLQAYYGDSCSPTFNPSKSSTYAIKVRNGFNITYLDGTGATGSYITDDLEINGVTIKSLQMGLATSVVRGVGVLGVGFPQNEAAVTQYPNIIDELADQGFISSRAFSLYLNDRRANSGTLLFGGVDAAKFIGPLHVLPIPKQPTGYTHYGVVMSSLSTTYSNGTEVAVSDSLVGAILDSGTTLSYLPDDIATPLFDELGVYTDYQTSGYSMIDCAYLDSEPDLVVTFGFGNGQASGGDKFTIAVPVYELVLDLLGGYSQLTADAPFDNVCLFGIQSSGSSFGGSDGTNETTSSEITLLGDTFLRSAYVVYDLDHHQIGMAQANLNATGETDITELTSAGSGLPTVTGVSAQQTTAGTTTSTSTRSSGTSSPSGSATSGNGAGQTTGTGTATPTPNAAPSGRVGGAEAFLVVLVAGLCSVAGGALFVL
ncbi:acid protease [Coniochaeta ligniaria NRRL 30616]|uniref:Acid protease n=1 Tax=Coniochaeta ligniaria NRRL 30616 TaxID=1408157 RepID=A0A1J7IUN7_9PEZI|nr:acid protease [Coniochaeta ligniaria NRRL 30616]